MFFHKMIGEKRRYWQYKERIKHLPPDYRAAVEAFERYFMYFGGISDGQILTTMLEDFADLFEQSAANGTPIRDVVGNDPVEFAETFLQNYAEGQWINKERARLVKAIELASGNTPSSSSELIPQ